MYRLVRTILFLFEPECAHGITLRALKLIYKLKLTFLFPKVADAFCEVMGIKFANPVGIAAGFDKKAEAIDAIAAMGFGFIEVGTVTPYPQSGNPKPRVFRLIKDQALINRLGFNGIGLEKFISNLEQAKYHGVLMISITQNNDTLFEQAIDDYIKCFEAVYPFATIISVNISCPNVPNKKSFETSDKFPELLASLKNKQAELKEIHKKYVPIVIKLSPDLPHADLVTITQYLKQFKIDGVIATNTTVSRPSDLKDELAKEKGGLSGKPLFPLALQNVRDLKSLLGDDIPIIALGGIDSAESAQKMFAAGASLAQVYTGLIYKGPKLVQEIVTSLC